jgi:hypothetical protein
VFLTKRKVCRYIRLRIVGGKVHSSPWLAQYGMTYANVISVPAKNIYSHTSPLIFQVAPVCLTLYGQRCIRCENVFTPCGRGPQGIPMSSHPRCVAKSKSQGRHSVHISRYGLSSCKPRHEGTGPGFTSPGKRFSYVFIKTYSLLIGASLQNSKLPKVNPR